MENRYYLPRGVFVEREYTEETDRRRRILRPYLRAAKNMNHYSGRCRITWDKLVLNGRKYGIEDLDSLPNDLCGYSISSKHSRDGTRMCFFGEMNPLSNFHKASFKIGSTPYHSTEQYIQKAKADHFGATRVSEEIMKTSEPIECKMIARNIEAYDHSEWIQVAKEKCKPGWQLSSTKMKP